MTTPSPNAPASTPDVGGVEPLTAERARQICAEWCTAPAHSPVSFNLMRRVDRLLLAIASGAHRVVPACDVQGWTMHEDELPPMSDEQYEKWFEASYIPGGVGCRVGPMVLSAEAPVTPVQETGAAATAKIIPDLWRGK